MLFVVNHGNLDNLGFVVWIQPLLPMRVMCREVIFDGVPGLDIDEDESYWERQREIPPNGIARWPSNVVGNPKFAFPDTRGDGVGGRITFLGLDLGRRNHQGRNFHFFSLLLPRCSIPLQRK